MVQLEPPLQSVALPTSVFQFHYGSIRTPLTGRIIMRQFCFNSIKVQLEPQILDIPICGTFRFQFHKGSIRTTTANKKTRGFALFQFHKGSIRTLILRLVESSFVSSFNSIKVQLEH